MRYLHTTRNCPDHWYPLDLKKRARVDEYLDWHHSNLRMGTGGRIFKKMVAPKLGIQTSDQDLMLLVHQFKYSIKLINHWLSQHKYLCGDEISIADLSAHSELTQLGFLQNPDGNNDDSVSFDGYEKVKQWDETMRAIPEVEQVSKLIFDLIKLFHKKNKKSAKL